MNMTLLAINWGLVGIKAGQLILSLSIIVILHEFGHYVPAKLFKCRVEKFFLFFDPWFALVKKKIGDTVYGIGWLPLGGYVKISGMIDESMDKDTLAQPAQPWEFRSKPAWQRLIIMVGGVTVNVLMAFIIYAMILFTWGERKTPEQNLVNGISIADSLMYDLGFKDGDKILAINNQPIIYYEDVLPKLVLGEKVTVERDGQRQMIDLPVNLIGKLVEKKRRGLLLFLPRVPVIVSEVPDTTNAAKAGLKQYDKIIGIDSTHVIFYDQLKKIIDLKKGQYVSLLINRNEHIDTLHTLVSKEGTLGFYRYLDPESLDSLGLVKVERKTYGFFESFPAGTILAIEKLKSYIDQFKKILSPKTEAYKGLGGFKAMGSAFPSIWDWQSFWSITAFFCIALAFMNLLPIPALDGGHVLFTLIEMVTGKKPSQKFLEYAQVAGMVLLLALVIFANGNDWFGWGKGK
jgi:regulator of sigma E protease